MKLGGSRGLNELDGIDKYHCHWFNSLQSPWLVTKKHQTLTPEIVTYSRVVYLIHGSSILCIMCKTINMIVRIYYFFFIYQFIPVLTLSQLHMSISKKTPKT